MYRSRLAGEHVLSASSRRPQARAVVWPDGDATPRGFRDRASGPFHFQYGEQRRQHYFHFIECERLAQAGAGAAAVSYQFTPLALDLESFQRTALESGGNTSDKSLPISLMLNVGAGAVAAEAINLDCFVSFDSLYFIDEIGNIRVSM